MTDPYTLAAIRTANSIRCTLDRDERRAVALCAAWECRTKLLPVELVQLVTRRRVIDAVRQRDGKTGRNRHQELEEHHHPVTVDPDPTDPTLTELIDLYSNGDPRLTHILACIAVGDPYQAIAAQLDIHPSRISQILAKLRRTHQEPPL